MTEMPYFWPHSLTVAAPPSFIGGKEGGEQRLSRNVAGNKAFQSFVLIKVKQNFLISQICKPKWTISGEISILKAKSSLTPFFHRALQLYLLLLLLLFFVCFSQMVRDESSVFQPLMQYCLGLVND